MSIWNIVAHIPLRILALTFILVTGSEEITLIGWFYYGSSVLGSLIGLVGLAIEHTLSLFVSILLAMAVAQAMDYPRTSPVTSTTTFTQSYPIGVEGFPGKPRE